MKVLTIFILIASPIISFGQNGIFGKFVDKSFGKKYIEFRSDSTFTFQVNFHLQSDIGCGVFRMVEDTIYLKYQYDMTDSCCNLQRINVSREVTNGKFELIIEPETAWRPDTLFHQNNLLFEYKNGKVRTQTTTFQIEPNGSKLKNAKRKYILFGPNILKQRPTIYTKD